MGLFNLFGKKADYEPATIYLDLRKQALSLTPDQIPSLLDPCIEIIAVLMENGYDSAVVTLVAVADGSVSLYFGNGGGLIGMGEHEEPRKASLDFLSFANQFVPEARLTSEFPLPAKGYTTFYFITKNGIRTLSAKESDLEKGRLPFSPLFYKAHEVITQARLMDEKMQIIVQELPHTANFGDATKMMELLNKNINPNYPDSSGRTPLMVGAYSGHTKILDLLLDQDAMIDQKDSSGYTALMYACNVGNFDCVKLLVERGANIHEEANDGSTPIIFSAQHGHNDIVRLLLSTGADPNREGQHGLSAIDFAKQNGMTETELILEGKK